MESPPTIPAPTAAATPSSSPSPNGQFGNRTVATRSNSFSTLRWNPALVVMPCGTFSAFVPRETPHSPSAPSRSPAAQRSGDRIPCSSTSSVEIHAPLPHVHQRVPSPPVQAPQIPVPGLDVLGRLGPAQHQDPIPRARPDTTRRDRTRLCVYVRDSEKLGDALGELLRYAPRRMRVVRHDVHAFLTQQRRPVPGPGAHLDNRSVQTRDGGQCRIARHGDERWGKHTRHELVKRQASEFAKPPPMCGTNRAGSRRDVGPCPRSPPRRTRAGRNPRRTGSIARSVKSMQLRHAPRGELVANLGVHRGVHVAVRVERLTLSGLFADSSVRLSVRSVSRRSRTWTATRHFAKTHSCSATASTGKLLPLKVDDALDRRVVRRANRRHRRLRTCTPEGPPRALPSRRPRIDRRRR